MQQLKRLVWAIIFTVIVLGSLSGNNSPVISSFTLQGRMPEDQYFRIEVSTEAENVDLIEARGSIVPIGRYRLFSNVEMHGSSEIESEMDRTRFKLYLTDSHAPILKRNSVYCRLYSHGDAGRWKLSSSQIRGTDRIRTVWVQKANFMPRSTISIPIASQPALKCMIHSGDHTKKSNSSSSSLNWIGDPEAIWYGRGTLADRLFMFAVQPSFERFQIFFGCKTRLVGSILMTAGI